jgi:hypothetical protein
MICLRRINTTRRIQAVNPALKSAIGRSNVKTLAELSGAPGYPLYYKNAQDVDKAIEQRSPGY